MSKVKLTLPGREIPVTGKQVTFQAPCDCSGVEALQIDGVDYAVCDSLENEIAGRGIWCSGASVTVVLNVEKQKAYVLNSAPIITSERIRNICT